MEEQVFGPFAQVKNGGQFRDAGFGLGLHILAASLPARMFRVRSFTKAKSQGLGNFHMDYATCRGTAPEVSTQQMPAADAPALQHRDDLPENVQV